MKVKRFFLELPFSDKTAYNFDFFKGLRIELDKSRNYEINKYFYKQIGVDHYWRDRLVWSDSEWKKYVKNKNLETWIMKKERELVGFYEAEFHPTSNEVELINMGILKDYRGKKLGSKLLSHIIVNSFKKKPKRIWVHTCSLDHKYALQNYKNRGFILFKEEEISFVA